MKNILIVAMTSYAGMGPYVSEIVNDFFPEDNVYYLFREYNDNFFSLNIKKDLHPKCWFVKIPNTRWNTFRALLNRRNRLWKYIVEICKEREIGLVHFINFPSDYHTINLLKTMGICVVSTIHDLHAHEAKKEWYKMLRQKIEYYNMEKNIRSGNNFITNSINQEQDLKQKYPFKNIFYHPFPSLVTEIVKNGKDIPQELQGLNKPYILFFGRIEEYKGVSLLYEAFVLTPEINNHYSLVIAGKGTNTILRISNESNVIFLNRYIKDTEVAYLFKNAKVVVYPYISATQSGVLTLAFYFGTPIVASDVPFFKELIKEDSNGMLFRSGDVGELRKTLLKLLNSNSTTISIAEKEYYKNNYTKGVQRKALLDIYMKLLS